MKYISKDAYDFFKKSQIFGGELIFCKIGSAGQNYVMPFLNRPVSLGLNQIMVRIKDRILMPYLYQYLHTDFGEYLISGCINGAVTKTITKTELKKIPVMLPPMRLQEEYATFINKVDKSKFRIIQYTSCVNSLHYFDLPLRSALLCLFVDAQVFFELAQSAYLYLSLLSPYFS